MISLMTSLYPYQQEAVNKLLPLRVGALYMEMGTGKTRVALELIQKRIEKGKVKKVLWLCPCSVKKNLRDDLDKHAMNWDDLIRICGIETLSGSDQAYLDLMQYVDSSTMCIVDESNLVKNYFTKRTKRIFEIGKPCRYRLILNGTPISRNEADLYAQWYFLDPRIFGYRTFWSFAMNHLEYDEHHKVRRVLDVDYLAEKIEPYSVVKRKDEVIELPGKFYQNRYFPLTRDQQMEYRDVLDDFLCDVDEFNETTIYRLFNALQLVTSGRRVIKKGPPIKHEKFFNHPLDNPRIKKLMEIIDESDEKTIVWVKYVHEAEDIKRVLSDRAAMLIGKLNVKKRNEEIERFKNDPYCQFLIANKNCGGYGLNLQFCHRSIYYDNDFDYATRAQSEDRIHRIGQDHDCEIINIMADEKIDERIVNCLDRKENLCDAVRSQIKAQGKESLRDYLNGKNTNWPKQPTKTLCCPEHT